MSHSYKKHYRAKLKNSKDAKKFANKRVRRNINDLPKKGKGYKIAENVVVTGEDIQQVLLAKAAIYSAIELLVREANMSFDDIDHLYVSGGLGASIGVWAASGIGIFPKELLPKFEAVGNTSLLGAIDYVIEGDEAILNEIRAKSKVVILNDNPEFEKMFLDNLKLED